MSIFKAGRSGFIMILAAMATVLAAQPGFCQPANASGLLLVGTIQGQGFGGAVFQDTTGKQVFYRLQERLPDGSIIIALRRNSISLKSAEGAVFDMYISRDKQHSASSAPPSSAARGRPPFTPPDAPTTRAIAEQARARRAHVQGYRSEAKE